MSPREDRIRFQPSAAYDYDDESESEFDDLDDSGWFAAYVDESKPAKTTSPIKEPAVTRRSSIKKFTVPLKETSKQKRRSSVRLLSKNKRATLQDLQRVRETVGRSSLYLHRDRLHCSNVAKAT